MVGKRGHLDTDINGRGNDYDNDVITDGLATKGFSHQRLVFLPFSFPLLPKESLPKEVREGFQYGERRSGRFEQPYLP